jgi:hypothetical protein
MFARRIAPTAAIILVLGCRHSNPNSHPDPSTAPQTMNDVTDDHVTAHKHSIRHHDEVMRSESCGCFYCGLVFAPTEIKEWVDDGESSSVKTALCPHCGIDSVIGSASGFPITSEFLHRMSKHWF